MRTNAPYLQSDDQSQSAIQGRGALDPVLTNEDACLLTLSGILSEYSETLNCQEK